MERVLERLNVKLSKEAYEQILNEGDKDSNLTIIKKLSYNLILKLKKSEQRYWFQWILQNYATSTEWAI